MAKRAVLAQGGDSLLCLAELLRIGIEEMKSAEHRFHGRFGKCLRTV